MEEVERLDERGEYRGAGEQSAVLETVFYDVVWVPSQEQANRAAWGGMVYEFGDMDGRTSKDGWVREAEACVKGPSLLDGWTLS